MPVSARQSLHMASCVMSSVLSVASLGMKCAATDAASVLSPTWATGKSPGSFSIGVGGVRWKGSWPWIVYGIVIFARPRAVRL